MKSRWLQRSAGIVASGLTLAALAFSSITPINAAPFDGARQQFTDERFATVWNRTDSVDVRSERSWYWGPGPWFDYAEFYRHGEQGLRTVQYFDKARMELNHPEDRSGWQQGVTNGLLVKELVSGRMQLGDNPYDVDERSPADVPVAGNPRSANPNAPGYGAFAGVTTVDNGYRDPNRIGQRINTTIDRGGNLGLRDDLATEATEIVQYNTVTGHNIPRVFWDFMNLQGRVYEDGRVRTGVVVDWLFAMGYPVSDAYWTRSQIGGVEKDVLVQLFERRVLTYVPDNPEGYKVEMGNVGQHYFQWRYPHLGQPWATSNPNPPLVYATEAFGTSHWEVAMYATTGSVRLTNSDAESVGYSYRRSFQPDQTRILIDSRRSDGEHRQIYEFAAGALYGGGEGVSLRRITYSDGATPPIGGPYPGWLPNGAANEYNAAYSPDGTKILFISDRMGNPEVFIMTASGNSPAQLTSNGCVNESPGWSPDGRSVYWASNCGGDFELYRAEITYQYDTSYGVAAQLSNVRQLTDNASDDRFGRVSPDGEHIAFTSNREGNDDIYVINSADGGGERRLTINNANDDAPTWSADGQILAFASDRDGDFEIYTMNLDGNEQTQLTNNNVADRWPMWAQ